jgi:hypothetical protein
MQTAGIAESGQESCVVLSATRAREARDHPDLDAYLSVEVLLPRNGAESRDSDTSGHIMQVEDSRHWLCGAKSLQQGSPSLSLQRQD